MPQRRGLISPQNTFLDTIATRFDGTHSNFVLGNAQSKDYPIVYCSDGFVELTGFSRAQIMSKSCSCSFLWGNDISAIEKSDIMDALNTKSELKMEVAFHKRDGTSFLCLLDVVPIKNEKDQVVLFLVSHKNLSECPNLLSSMDQEDMDVYEESNVDEVKNVEISTSHKYQRRRSRAVLYQLSGQYSGKQKSKFDLENFRHKRALPEYKVQEKSDKLIILHYSLFKIIWDWLILLCTFYIAIYVPYNVVFLGGDRNFFVFDIFVEVLFSIDIALNFRTTYVNKAGQVVYKPSDIARNYMTGWFVLDLFAALPFEAMSNIETKLGAVSSQIQMMKLARLLRLIRLIQKIDRYAQYSFVLLALLMCAFALCAHWMACIWYLIGNKELQSNRTREINWLYELSLKINRPYINETAGGPGLRSIYISSLYFTCTSITSVGFGNVAPNTDAEKIFSICSMLVGALMHAAIFGNVTAIIQRMYARKTTYQTKNQDLKDFTKVHHIPKSLKQRMLEFFQTNWAINRGIEPSEILKDFPEEMRGEISLHLNKEMMSLALFDKASNACRKSLAQQIKTIFATPGEYLLRRGDAIKYVFFVCSGSMEILDQDESVVALLGKFDLFGPDVSHYPSRSGYEVRALTYCELQCLILDCMEPLYEQYPEFKAHFTTSIINELSFNVCDQAHEIHGSKESLVYLDNSSDTINALPVISEKEEDSSSDQSSPIFSDDQISERDIKSFNHVNPSISSRRFSQPECHKNGASSFIHHSERRYSLPSESHTVVHLQKQLDQITLTNNNMITQISHIQKSVDKLSGDIKYMNHIIQNRFLPVKNMTSSDSTINRSSGVNISKYGSEHQMHSSPENRVTFDLHPQEITTNEPPDLKVTYKNFKPRSQKSMNSFFNKKLASS